MRRGYLTLLGALFIASSDSPVLGRAQEPSKPTDASVLSFEGDTALWTVAIKPDKTADFEQTLSKLRSALAKSQDPQRRRQAAGWKVMRMTRPLPDGNVAFVHIIHPVVAGADYAIMPILYDAFPEERVQLYDLYRGAFAANVAAASGNLVANLGGLPTPGQQ
jgi:hypothetical protein